MSREHEEQFDPRTQQAIEEIRGLISERYPGTHFRLARGDDEPTNIHLITTVDLDDPGEVSDLVSERLVELQVDERIPLYVIPIRTPERIVKELQAERRPGRKIRRIISAGPELTVGPQEGGAA